MEIVAVIVSVFLTGSVAYLAYQYRGLITYQQLTLNAKILIDGNKLSLSENGKSVYFEKIEICNRGYTNVDSFEFHDDLIHDLVGYRVISTTSVGKNTVTVEQHNKSVCISARVLPRREKIEVLLIFSGPNHFWNAKGGGSKYELRPQAYFDGMTMGSSFVKTGTLVSLLLYYIWDLIHYV